MSKTCQRFSSCEDSKFSCITQHLRNCLYLILSFRWIRKHTICLLYTLKLLSYLALRSWSCLYVLKDTQRFEPACITTHPEKKKRSLESPLLMTWPWVINDHSVSNWYGSIKPNGGFKHKNVWQNSQSLNQSFWYKAHSFNSSSEENPIVWTVFFFFLGGGGKVHRHMSVVSAKVRMKWFCFLYWSCQWYNNIRKFHFTAEKLQRKHMTGYTGQFYSSNTSLTLKSGQLHYKYQ